MERLEFGYYVGFRSFFHGSQLQTKVHLRAHLFVFWTLVTMWRTQKATAAVQAEASGPTKVGQTKFLSQLNVLRLSKFSDLDRDVFSYDDLGDLCGQIAYRTFVFRLQNG